MRQQQPPCVVHSLSGADVSSGSEAEGEEELAGLFEIKMNLQKVRQRQLTHLSHIQHSHGRDSNGNIFAAQQQQNALWMRQHAESGNTTVEEEEESWNCPVTKVSVER